MYLKDDPEIRQLMANCFLSTRTFCKTLFPERFTRPFAKQTDRIFHVLDSRHINKGVIAAPRGWGKTSTVNMGYPAKNILFREKKFIVPVSCTATSAVIQSENLKNKLRMNRIVKELFGDVESKDLPFAKDMWQSSYGTMVLPRGAGQQVRGILSDDDRPDLIIVDDLEDKEGVKNPEQRKKLAEWFYSDLINTVDLSSDDYKIIVIGTVLHENSLLRELLDDPSWFAVELELCDDNYNSYWPEYITSEKVKEMAEEYARKGLLHLFFMEFRNKVVATDAPFLSQYFRYYDEAATNLNKDRNIESVVIYDPAKSTNPRSAYTAIVGIGIDTQSRKLYIRDVINEKLHPEEQYQAAFDMCYRLGARVLAFEVSGLNEFITHPIKTMASAMGLTLEFVELNPRGGSRPESKEKRVAALIPFYRQGLIYHNQHVCGPLEAQLLSFPRSKFWDVMDCTAYIVELLELGDRYMMPDQDDPEEEFDDLDWDDDPPLSGDWRII